MKRLFLTFLCVLFAYPCFAAEPIQLARMNPWVAGSVAAGANYTNCSQINANGHTNSFAWFGDHASGTGYGCKDASTSINAAYTDGTRNDTTPSTSFSKGVNTKFSGSSSFSWQISGGNLVSVTEGLFQVDVYMSAVTGNNTVICVLVDGDNYIELRLAATGVVRAIFMSGGAYIDKTSSAQVPATTWTTISMRYKNTGAGSRCDVKVGANAWETGTDTLSAWTGTPAFLDTNGARYFTDTFYIDNIFISKSSGL